MSDLNKTQGISATSLIDLKTELLRKQQEFHKEKELGSTGRSHRVKNDKKSGIWSRSNAGVLDRAQKDYEAKNEEDDVLAKSRKVLEAKARAYDEMMSGNTIPDTDTNERFLVDFERKAIDKLIKMKHQIEAQEQDSGRSLKESQEKQLNQRMMQEQVAEPEDPDEHWVDYIDILGRSRRCMKKDLPSIKKIDEQLTGKKNLVVDALKRDESLPELMSDDMYREKMRQQWEEEEQRSMEQPETHYANVQFNEVRDHGVAYYQFNKDSNVRKEQMDNLSALRKQTKQNREAQQKVKDKRNAMMAARLAKVRQRKMIREGKDPNEIMEHQDISEDSDDDVVGPKMAEKCDNPEILQRDDSWRRSAPVREWDKGKEDLQDFLTGHTLHSEGSWKEKLRQERDEEFAPPSLYNEMQHKYKAAKGKRSFITLPDQSMTKKWKPESNPVSTLSTKSVQSATVTGSSCVVDVGTMLAGIRAQAEESQNKTLKNVVGVTSSDLINLAEIPLPPPQTINEQQHETIQSVVVPPRDNYGISSDLSQLNHNSDAHVNITKGLPNDSMSTAPQQWDLNSVTSGHSSVMYGHSQVTKEMLPPDTQGGNIISQPPVASASSILVAPTLGPQPAHFSSGPMKPQMPKARYERVNLHELPLELPAPPTANNIPAYPSQEEVIGPRNNKNELECVKKLLTEDQARKQWQRQFHIHNQRDIGNIKPNKIPFQLPYVQNENKTELNADPAATFDPSKPPPNVL